MKYFIRFRPITFFFRKNWYCLNRIKLEANRSLYENYSFIIDLGAITIGKRKYKGEVK